MNAEKLLALADSLEASETYSQATYAHDCRSPGCVAGHAIAMEPGWTLHRTGCVDGITTMARNPDNEPVSPFDAARQILELSNHQAERLFHIAPYMYDWNGGATLKEEAAAACRYLAENGVVRWPERQAA